MKRKKNVRRQDDKALAPFIIGAEVATLFGDFVTPVGVVLATSELTAWQVAIRRWPECVLVRPYAWEKMCVEVRLAALDAEDRQFSDAFRSMQP